MYCYKCGKPLKEGDIFCSSWGNQIHKSEEIVQNLNQVVPENTAWSGFALFKRKGRSERIEAQRILLKLILIAISILVFLEVFLILFNIQTDMKQKVWESALVIIYMGFFANAALSYYNKTEFKTIAIGIVSMLAANFITHSLTVWLPSITTFASFNKLYASIIIILFAFVHNAFVAGYKRVDRNSFLAVYLTGISIVITYSMVIGIIIFSIKDEFYMRLLFVMVILTAFGSVASSLLKKMARNWQVKKIKKET